MKQTVPIILCGGIGKRLAPISTKKRPKQFIRCFSGKSSFQNTLERARAIASEHILIICHEVHKETVLEQSLSLNIHNIKIVTERAQKNTAFAIALSLLYTTQSDQLIIFPADHLITDNQKTFHELNTEDSIFCFGLPITHIQTQYGYIEHNNDTVSRFIEKPNATLIKQFINNGHYLWNSGIYAVTHRTLKLLYAEHAPHILKACQNMQSFENLQPISFDKAIMEKAENIKIVKANISWTDIGSWKTFLYNYYKHSISGHKHRDTKHTV